MARGRNLEGESASHFGRGQFRGEKEGRRQLSQTEEGIPVLEPHRVLNEGVRPRKPYVIDKQNMTARLRGSQSLESILVATPHRVKRSMNEADLITSLSFPNTQYHTNSGLWTRPRNLGDTDVNNQLHAARQSCDGTRKESSGPHQTEGHVEERPNYGDVEDECQLERMGRLEVDTILQGNSLKTDGDSSEDFEDGLRAGKPRRGRKRYSGVGPGLHLPTRMHYFDEQTSEDDLAHEAPGRGLRRIPVIDFRPLLVRKTLGPQFRNTISRIVSENFPIHCLPNCSDPLHPNNEHTPRQPTHEDDHRVLESEISDALNDDSDSADVEDNEQLDDSGDCSDEEEEL